VRQEGWLGWLPDEALRVCGVGSAEHLLPGVTHRRGSPLMHGGRRHQPNAGVAMLAVVPGEEGLAEDAGVFEAAEAFREVRAILQRFELGLGEGVIVAGIGSAVRLGDPQVDEQPRDGPRFHRGAAIRMQGQLPRLDLLLLAGVCDEPLGQYRRLCRGDHPADHVAAEDIQNDIEVAVRPFHGAQKLAYIPGPYVIGGGRQEFRLLIDRVAELVPALLDLRLFIEDAVQGSDGTVVAAFIEQGGIDRGRSFVDEPVAVQGREHRLPLLGRQGARGARTRDGLLHGSLPAIEPRTHDAEGVTGWLDADLRGQ